MKRTFIILAQFGLDLELVYISATLPGVQALVRGDLDISSNCIAEHISPIKEHREARVGQEDQSLASGAEELLDGHVDEKYLGSDRLAAVLHQTGRFFRLFQAELCSLT